jgi:glycosyltransferase involved in cell wall biosynthesis
VAVLIILSVHNAKQYANGAIASILAQTFSDFELIIIDDGSTDGTADLLKEFTIKDTRVRIITNETNIGLTRSLNLALKQARGEYIARMDADDIALPNRLERQIAFLKSHPDISIVGTAYEWIDKDGNVIGKPKMITGADAIHRALPRTNPLLHSSVMIRRSALDQVGGYNETMKRAQDYDLWLRLSRTCKFENLSEVLMQKRVTRNIISFKNEREQIRFALLARLNALKRGDFPLWCAIYLLKPFLATILPSPLVTWVRIHLFNQKIYAHESMR